MLSDQSMQIRQMFSAIAHRYDLLNHLLSLHIDKIWRRKAISLIQDTLARSEALCLDLCCGTGDLGLAMARAGKASVTGCDFSHPMLRLNAHKVAFERLDDRIRIVEADALNLPFQTGTFDALAIAFGLRNLDNVLHGLLEMRRVLKSSGKLVVLEFSKPTNQIFNRLFQFYFFKVLPWIGNTVSRHRQAYSYLPASVRQFPNQAELTQIMQECGFQKVQCQNLSGGIAAIHYGERR